MPEPTLFAHQQQDGGDRHKPPTLKKLPDVISSHPRLVDSYGVEFNACPNYSLRWCPRADDPNGKCDVCDVVTPERAMQIEKKGMHKKKVIAKRAARGKTPSCSGAR